MRAAQIPVTVVAREFFLNLGRFAGGVSAALLLALGLPASGLIMAAGLAFLLYPVEVVRGRFYPRPRAS
ncbi:MAG: hypothetical protein QXQ87_03735 [Halobacteria archaeon]